MKPISPINLAAELFSIHTHAEIAFEQDPEQIVYTEAKLLEVLKSFGFPDPDWDGNARRIELELISSPWDTLIETIDAKGLSLPEFAPKIGYTWDEFNLVLTEKRPLTKEVASKLETALGIPATFWNNREALYREKLIRIDELYPAHKKVDSIDGYPVETDGTLGSIHYHLIRIQQAVEIHILSQANITQHSEINATATMIYKLIMSLIEMITAEKQKSKTN